MQTIFNTGSEDQVVRSTYCSEDQTEESIIGEELSAQDVFGNFYISRYISSFGIEKPQYIPYNRFSRENFDSDQNWIRATLSWRSYAVRDWRKTNKKNRKFAQNLSYLVNKFDKFKIKSYNKPIQYHKLTNNNQDIIENIAFTEGKLNDYTHRIQELYKQAGDRARSDVDKVVRKAVDSIIYSETYETRWAKLISSKDLMETASRGKDILRAKLDHFNSELRYFGEIIGRDNIVNFIDIYQCAFTLHVLVNSRSCRETIAAFVNLLAIFSKSQLAEEGTYLTELFHQFWLDICWIKHFQNVEPEEVQTEGLFQDAIAFKTFSFELKHIRENMQIVMKSNVVALTRNLLLQLVGLKFFSISKANMFIKSLGQPKESNLFDFLTVWLDTVEGFITFADDVSTSGSILKGFTPNDPCNKFIGEAGVHKASLPLIYVGEELNFRDNVQGKMSAFKYRARLQELIILGENLLKSHNNVGVRRAVIELRSLYNDIATLINSKHRDAPLGVCIFGFPRIGKSALLEHLYKAYCHAKGYKFTQDLVYTKSALSPYWDMYDPFCNKIVHISEAGNVAEHAARTRGVPGLDEILSIMDKAAMSTNQSAVENKGKVFFNSDLVAIDTNVEKMGYEHVVHSVSAALARFIFVHPEVNAEFRLDGSDSVDSNKVENAYKLGLIKDKLDIYTFKVYKKKAISHSESSDEFYKPTYLKPGQNEQSITMDIYQLSAFYISHFEKYEAHKKEFNKVFETDFEFYLNPENRYVGSTEGKTVEEDMGYADEMAKFLAVTSAVFYFGVNTLLRCLPLYRLTSFLSLILMFGSVSWLSVLFWVFGDQTYDLKRKMVLVRFVTGEKLANYSTYVSVAVIALIVIKIFLKGIDYVMHFATNSAESLSDDLSKVSNKEIIEENFRILEEQAGCRMPRPTPKNDLTMYNQDAVYHRTIAKLAVTDKMQNSFDEVMNGISSRRYWVRIMSREDPKMPYTTRGFGIYGNFMLINSHALMDKTVLEMWISRTQDDDSKRKFSISPGMFIDLGNDVTLICLQGAMMGGKDEIVFGKKSILDLFANSVVDHDMLGYIGEQKVTVSPYGLLNVHDVPTHRWFTLRDTLSYQCKHEHGMCGEPLVLYDDKITFIAGIHAAGSSGDLAWTTPILRKDLENAINKFTKQTDLIAVFAEGNIKLPHGRKLGVLSRKYPGRFMNTQGIYHVGGVDNWEFTSAKSSLTPSKLLPYIEDVMNISPYVDGHLKFGKPKFNTFFVDGEYRNPYNIWMSKVSVCRKILDYNICTKVVNLLVEHIVDRLVRRGVTQLDPVTQLVAINGHPEVSYMRPMVTSTSAGVFFPGGKKAYLEKVSVPWKDEAWKANYEVQQMMNQLVEDYCNERLGNPINGAQLKDEPRDWDKCEAGKTRVFAMSPIHYLILSRMFLMPFYSMMAQHRDAFYTKIGMNMFSVEAQTLRNDLLDFSTNIMEGDYGGYDTSMPISVGLMANTIVYKVLKYFKYKDFALTMVQGLLSDSLYPLVCLEGNLFYAPGFQPSGKYATAEDNSLRGLILMVYAFAITHTPLGESHKLNVTARYDLKDFFSLFLPVTYGDDMLCAVKDEVKDTFNNITYAEAVKDLFNMEFTSSTKSVVLDKFVEPERMSFLKRTFRWNRLLNRYVACLSHDSIVKSLTWVLPSKAVGVSPEKQEFETIASALRELFFWCDSVEEYDILRSKFILNCKKVLTHIVDSDYDKFIMKGDQMLEYYKNKDFEFEGLNVDW